MGKHGNPIALLVADDDAADRRLVKKAWEKSHLANDFYFVEDGEELMDYLNGAGKFSDRIQYPLPGVILLDLNMPRKDGREALNEIKANPKLRHIPVVVLTTSKDDQDIYRSYNLGANSYITKPVTFEALVEVMRSLGNYWFEIVELPPDHTDLMDASGD